MVREETNTPLKQYGITPEKWQILTSLFKRDSITPTELGEVTLRDKTAISRILPALFQKGIIEKKMNHSDGRSYMIKLNDQYRELIEKLFIDVKGHFQEKSVPDYQGTRAGYFTSNYFEIAKRFERHINQVSGL